MMWFYVILEVIFILKDSQSLFCSLQFYASVLLFINHIFTPSPHSFITAPISISERTNEPPAKTILYLPLGNHLQHTTFCIFVFNCPTGRVSVTALTKKQRKELKKMDRRHKANQLRRNKKDMVFHVLFDKTIPHILVWCYRLSVSCCCRSWQKSGVWAAGTDLLIWLWWYPYMQERMLVL